jgi:hypothetical protein
MIKHDDLTGRRFGSLTAVKENGRGKDRRILWECECDCGNKTNVAGRDLMNGHTKSCGCRQKLVVSSIRKKHGDRDARLYRVWKSMKKRCENPNDHSYKYYGAKGVKVCEEWHDYSKFKAWALENGYDEHAHRGDCTIDRINPCGDYEPSNCRWVSMAEQNRNKRAKMEEQEDGK